MAFSCCDASVLTHYKASGRLDFDVLYFRAHLLVIVLRCGLLYALDTCEIFCWILEISDILYRYVLTCCLWSHDLYMFCKTTRISWLNVYFNVDVLCFPSFAFEIVRLFMCFCLLKSEFLLIFIWFFFSMSFCGLLIYYNDFYNIIKVYTRMWFCATLHIPPFGGQDHPTKKQSLWLPILYILCSISSERQQHIDDLLLIIIICWVHEWALLVSFGYVCILFSFGILNVNFMIIFMTIYACHLETGENFSFLW